MKTEEYWLITLIYLYKHNTTKHIKYITKYFEGFPTREALLDDKGIEGNIIFMKELSKVQFDALTKEL